MDLFKWIDSVADGIDRISESRQNIIRVLVLWPFITTAALITYVIFTGRNEFLPVALDWVTYGQHNLELEEWSMLDSGSFPEFYDEQGKADLVKIQAIKSQLHLLNQELGSIRSIFNVYGPNYRQIAIQVSARGHRKLGREYWYAPTFIDGYSKNYGLHVNGLCTGWKSKDLPDGSYLKEGAKRYNTIQSRNCPVHYTNLGYNGGVMGYVSVDFSTELDETQQYQVDSVLKRYSKVVTDVLYHEP